MRADTGTWSRRSCGTAMAFLTWTIPSMSSQSSPMTGKREWPVRRARATTSVAVAVRSMAVARERGVITSAAVWSPNPIDAVRSRAVWGSRVPASAELRTRNASSCGFRAAESSSCGSTPTARSTRLAEPLSSQMSGRATAVNARTGSATTFAVAKGAEKPRNCGTSSPTIIEKTVAMRRAMRFATVSSAGPPSPIPPSGTASSDASAGVVRKPRARVVMVIPTWAPDSWVESWRREERTARVLGSPRSTARWTVGRSRATSENSAATKSAVPRVRTTPARTSNHSVMAAPS